MTLKQLRYKKIALLGLGTENYALALFLLKKQVSCQLTVCDQRSLKTLGDKFNQLNHYPNVTWQLGPKFKENLDRYDLLFRSPGWPLACPGIKQAQKLNNRIIVTSPMRLFFDLCPTKKIIGVTGTKGKGTTSSLICHILKTAGRKAYLGGNIGIAPFEFINQLTAASWVVLELSSFQLEDLTTSPNLAVITNFSPEHLAPADPFNPNYHRSLNDYRQAKFNICRWQKKTDWLIINRKLRSGCGLKTPASQVVYFAKSNLLTPLVGEHNKENIAAAEAVAKILKIKPTIVAKAVKNFTGLEHRLELVREINGVKYYDDSFATTPESTIIALKSFDAPIVLLAGGADKNASFATLALTIKKRVKFVCLLQGQATPRLRQALLRAGLNPKNLKIFTDFKQAIHAAKQLAVTGDIVLLSTACASFGMFKNYKERGDRFKTLVKKL